MTEVLEKHDILRKNLSFIKLVNVEKKIVEMTRISRKCEELDNSTDILDKVNFCCNILF